MEKAETLIATVPMPMNILQYQLVFRFIDGNKYLRSVNLMKDGKTLKKMLLKSLFLCEEATDMDSMVADIIIRNLNVIDNCDDKNKKHSARSAKVAGKPDNEARMKAAVNLLEILKFS